MSERKNTSKCKHDFAIRREKYDTNDIFIDGTVYIEDYKACVKCGKVKVVKQWTEDFSGKAR